MTDIPTREEAIAFAVEHAHAAEANNELGDVESVNTCVQLSHMWATLAPLLPPAPPQPSTLGVTPQQAFQAQIDTIMEDARRRIFPGLKKRGER